jgi:hypothetical protein
MAFTAFELRYVVSLFFPLLKLFLISWLLTVLVRFVVRSGGSDGLFLRRTRLRTKVLMRWTPLAWLLVTVSRISARSFVAVPMVWPQCQLLVETLRWRRRLASLG